MNGAGAWDGPGRAPLRRRLLIIALLTGACAVAVVAWAAYARLATGDHSFAAANAAANDVVLSGQDLEAA